MTELITRSQRRPTVDVTPIVYTEGLSKIYGRGDTAVVALRHIDLRIAPGEFVSVMGPSGCGKSTLLHLLGGLDQSTSGRIVLEGQDLQELDDTHLARIRRRKIGFVFQFYNLIPILSAQDNAALPLVLDGVPSAEAADRAEAWLQRVGLEGRSHHQPDQLSGGEQQRVAIARALVSEPVLILADEPTGNLDSRSADEITRLLRQISKEWGRTILMVSHNPRLAALADRIIFLKDGAIVSQNRLAASSIGGQVPGAGAAEVV